ncbi:MAG: class I SAM-dependent methyltransferase [Dermatophilaceae bacterium]
MSKYDTTLDPSASNTSHHQLLELVGGHKSVLDVGCATGYLAEALVQRGCVVSGIEYDRDAAEQAEQFLDQLVIGDLNELDLGQAFQGRTFDVIVLGDILEHLVEPEDVLARLVGLLAPGGSVVISIPNVAHGSIRLALLQGSWDYRDLGLMDRTHIRFFTRGTLLAMLRAAGLAAVDIRTTTLDPLGGEVPVVIDELPAGVIEWVREQPDAFSYQFLVRAVRDDAAGAVEAARLEREELSRRLADSEGVVAELRREIDTLRIARDRAEADVLAIQGTRSARALSVPRSLYARLHVARGAATER